MKNFEIWVREKFRDLEKKIKAGGGGSGAGGGGNVSINLNGTEEVGEVVPIDADYLGGVPAEDYATKQYVDELQAKLLLNSTSVTDTETEFALASSWKNYKQINVTVKMHYSNSTDIHYFSNDYYTFAVRTDYSYAVYRNVPANVAGEASLWITFLSSGSVKLRKIASVYNGCLEVWIYGIK